MYVPAPVVIVSAPPLPEMVVGTGVVTAIMSLPLPSSTLAAVTPAAGQVTRFVLTRLQPPPADSPPAVSSTV